MKMFVKLFGLALLACLSLFPFDVSAHLEVSATVQIRAKTDFEPHLAAHGTWVKVGSYGRCWRPAHVAVEWRPYCSGQWVWTDCGWYWESDEPWAWACYHYGTWVYEPSEGWVWVPGVEWAPAWVSWRVGGGYIGWAPVAPPGLLFAKHPAPDLFVFVGAGHFGGRIKPATVIVKNKSIWSKAPEVGGIKRETRTISGSSRGVMVNHGPGVEMVQKATGRTFSPVPIHQAAGRSAVPTSVRRDSGGAKLNHEPQAAQKEERKTPARDAASDQQRGLRSRERPHVAGGGDKGGRPGSGHGKGRR